MGPETASPEPVKSGYTAVPTPAPTSAFTTEEPFIEFGHFGDLGGEGTTSAPTAATASPTEAPTASPTAPPTDAAADGWGWGSPEPTVEPLVHGEFECSAMADILLVLDGSSS